MASLPAAADSVASVRRAELMAALDIATGVALERSLRSCLVGQGLAEAMGFSDDQRSDADYVSLLHWLGCTADSDEAARVFGDELAVGEWIQPVIGDGPFAVLGALIAKQGRGEALPQCATMLIRALTGMPK